MLVGGVIDDEVDDKANATLFQARQKPVEVSHRSEDRHDLSVVADVVAVIDIGAGVVGTEPHHVDAECRDIVELGR